MDLKFFFHRKVILSRRLKYALKGSFLLLSHKAQLYCFWTKHCLQVVHKRVWLTCNSFEGKILILKRLDAADRIQSSPISDCLIIFGLRNGNIYIIPYDLLSATFFKRCKFLMLHFVFMIVIFNLITFRYFVNGGHQACFLVFSVYGPQIYIIEHT